MGEALDKLLAFKHFQFVRRACLFVFISLSLFAVFFFCALHMLYFVVRVDDDDDDDDGVVVY